MSIASKTVAHIIKQLVPSSVLRSLQRLLYGLAKLSFRLASGVQIQLLSQVDWCIYNELFADCEYDPPISRLVNSAGGRVNVLDLGCNVGFFGLRLLDRFRASGVRPEINLWAIEPDETNLRELRRRVADQDAEITRELNLRLVNGLAGRKQGTAIFYQSHRYHASSVLKLPVLAGARGVERAYIDIDAIAPDVEWDLVKCDIEGSEGEFVSSYSDLLRRTKIFVVEIHPGTCVLSELRLNLQAVGLSSERILVERAGNQVVMFTRDASAV